jgi:hypothetical protein
MRPLANLAMGLALVSMPMQAMAQEGHGGGERGNRGGGRGAEMSGGERMGGGAPMARGGGDMGPLAALRLRRSLRAAVLAVASRVDGNRVVAPHGAAAMLPRRHLWRALLRRHLRPRPRRVGGMEASAA